jgi:nicotinamidase-related amidase
MRHSHSGLWFLDKLYGICFKTYRLDIVEFSPLPGRVGVQMLWRNPPGFNASSGEYVKVQIPWLSRGGSEWHPFSVYLREETAEGLDEVLRVNTTPERTHFNGGVVVPSGKRISPSSSTAVLLCEYQNEFASERGKLHEGVKTVMESTNMLQNTVNLVEYARTVGAHIFHLPRTALEENGIDNSNKNSSQYFSENTWNAEIVDCLKPDTGDIVIRNKKGLDGFNGTDLQEQLQNKGIDTIIIGGFLANCCVESTMRTGYEMGYNVITLEDGSACTSQEEQDASIQFTWKMFSTPMRCSDATKILGGVIPDRFQDEEELFQRSEDLPLSTCSISSSDRSSVDEEKGLLSLDTLGEELQDSAGDLVLRSFITHHHRTIITGGHIDVDSPNNTVKSLIKDEARQESRSQYTTTQVFIAPVGDWTKEVYDEVYHQRQLRHCWVKGPFVSPYSVVSKFSHLVLVASGIGITPALGVMGNYKGSSRTKVLVWTTRCPKMIKFFAPLLEDAAMAIIYYTGKEKFSAAELKRLTQGRNIYIQQSRPDNVTRTVGTVISSISSEEMAGVVDEWPANSVLDIPRKMRQQWCILYCGGSTKIHDMLSDYSKEVDVQFHTEMFDW